MAFFIKGFTEPVPAKQLITASDKKNNKNSLIEVRIKEIMFKGFYQVKKKAFRDNGTW